MPQGFKTLSKSDDGQIEYFTKNCQFICMWHPERKKIYYNNKNIFKNIYLK